MITEILTNEEMHLKFKQKYEEAVEYIKLLESDRNDKINIYLKTSDLNLNKDNNDLNKSINSAIAYENLSNNAEHFYFSDSPEFSIKNKLKCSSNLSKCKFC